MDDDFLSILIVPIIALAARIAAVLVARKYRDAKAAGEEVPPAIETMAKFRERVRAKPFWWLVMLGIFALASLLFGARH